MILFKLLHPKLSLIVGRNVLLTQRDRTPALVFRIGDLQVSSQLSRVQLAVSATYAKTTAEGERMVVRVVLPTSTTAPLHGAVTAMHPLTKTSPLHGLSTRSVGHGGVHDGLCITIQLHDRSVLYSSTMAHTYHFSDVLVGRAAFAALEQGVGCLDQGFDLHRFNLVLPLSPTRGGQGDMKMGAEPGRKKGSFDLGSSQTDSGGGGGGGGGGGKMQVLTMSAQPTMFATFGLRMQGPRRYWRRWINE
jgi:hypothetical protein